jgi:hypothetical protein
MSGRYDGLHGLIALSENPELINRAIQHGLGCYQVHSSEPVEFSERSVITFTGSQSIHAAFRNKALEDTSLRKVNRVSEPAESLAEADGKPVWAIDRTGQRESHRVGVDLPPFTQNDFFHNHFRSSRWFAMVPLLHFLRQLLGAEGWTLAEPRATFIIDDPNLHYRSYGYIDFEKLAKHAADHNYHATVATVPLDAWYFNRKVASLFLAHKQRISMMVHGVNHVADELARQYTKEEAIALLADGLRRIGAFESRSGIKVDRVMAAPHGAFAESIAGPMLSLGYEAACVSAGSLVRWNPDKTWPTLGLPMAQALGRDPFPVFHRTGANETEIRLSAFLGHPIVIATHHQDYVSNFARIESVANMVNEISPMRWMTIEGISRTNYVSRLEGGVFCVTPYARRLTISIPREAMAVQLLASPFCPEATIDLRQVSTDASRLFDRAGRFRLSVSNNALEISLPPSNPLDYAKVNRRPLGLWPIARRLLAEGRDRAKPLLSFVSTH